MVRYPEFIAPAVRIRRTGQIVLLLEWERNDRGLWRGHVAWLSRPQVAWRGVDVWMPAEDLERIEGQDYRRVPKRIEEPPF
ncbi:hypothetical protein [Actinomadura sp. DC4]|uniref:hypothetical protein n=1 Tax=Actinomadura sp. DC4 TaxID=3055069 RepID=UPI0025B039EC|nr:hypothetical protein [Actinomadura sp. DC4]MDN3356099.1 hypothetical protein [Actinomadura sp. DC4]